WCPPRPAPWRRALGRPPRLPARAPRRGAAPPGPAPPRPPPPPPAARARPPPPATPPRRARARPRPQPPPPTPLHPPPRRHGRTLATLTATGNRKVQAGFEPLVSGFVRAPYNDVAALWTIAANNPDVVAILVEPIQGEGGVFVPDAGYLQALRALCDEHQWLLMLDEVQTGNGRTGTFFNHQRHGILPDVVTTAKGLANGFPLGACLASGVAA